MRSIRLLGIGAASVIITGLSLSAVSATAADQGFSQHVDEQGNISFPKRFRSTMVHLGSWFVPEGEASGFHDVYTEKESVEAYRKTGKFPDGATIVKELRASDAGTYTTGTNVSYATDGLKQWFVMIKDEKGRFEDNPIWGDGWGWALYKPGDTEANVASNYKNDCLGCHVPARSNDWVYTEAYPTLSKED